MGSPLRVPQPIDEVLAWERRVPDRYEYVDGILRGMVGGTAAHNRIVLNLATTLQLALRNGPCQVFAESMKVVTARAFMYPDVVVTCAEIAPNSDEARAPTAVFEVLSSSTEEVDRARKWFAYQAIDSLQAYVLVAQDKIAVEIFTRQPGGWAYAKFQSLDDAIELPSPKVRLALREIYERVVA